MRSIFLLLCMTAGVWSQAQSQAQVQRLDSVKSVLRTYQNDSLREYYTTRVFFNYVYSDPDFSKLVVDYTERVSDSLKTDTLRASVHINRGVYYDVTGKQDSALVEYNRALNITERLKMMEQRAAVFNNKGLIFWNQDKLDLAIDEYLKAHNYYLDSDNYAGTYSTNNNLGLILQDLGRYQESKSYFLAALDVTDSLKYKRGIASSYSNLSNAYDNLKQKDSAIYYSKLAIPIQKEINDIRGLGLSYQNLSIQLDGLDESIEYMDKAIETFRRINANALVIPAQLNQATNYNKKGLYAAARDVVLDASKRIDSSDLYQRSKAARLLGLAYSGLGQNKKAAQSLNGGFSLFEKFKEEQAIQKANEAIEKYKVAEKGKELLATQNQLLDEELKGKKRNQQIGILVGVLAVGSLLGYFLIAQSRQRNKVLKKEAELKEAVAQVEAQNKLQQQRLRISRDLHDNIGSQLTYIISSVDNFKYRLKDTNPKVSDKLGGISSFTRNTIDQLRDTIWAMNKDSISIDDLIERLYTYVGKASELGIEQEIKIHKQVSGNPMINGVTGMHLYRCVQEAMNNSIKHADARVIDVYVTNKEKQISMRVQDDGLGFNPDTVDRNHGLNNLEQRMKDAGGSCRIQSRVDEGTVIEFTIPVD